MILFPENQLNGSLVSVVRILISSVLANDVNLLSIVKLCTSACLLRKKIQIHIWGPI